MNKINFLNLGCGDKYHKDWVNIDKYSNSPYVLVHDLFKRLPFDDDTFEVIYLSQVLEHFPKKHAPVLLKECRRVLKERGIIRIVVPDLEDITRNYLKFIEKNLDHATEESIANYDWMLLEMFDQDVRNASGGEMTEFLKKPVVINEKFIFDRIGFEGKSIRHKYLKDQKKITKGLVKSMMIEALHPKNWRKVFNYVKQKTTGKASLGGELHYWMYDRYSLKRLLENCGFREVKVKSPSNSDIPEWDKYELDIKNMEIYDPTALFMEARK